MKKNQGSIVLSAIFSLAIIYSCFYILNTSIKNIKILKLHREIIKSVETSNNKLKEIEIHLTDNFNKSKALKKDAFINDFCKKSLYKNLIIKNFELCTSTYSQELQKENYTHCLTFLKLDLLNQKFNRINSSKYIFSYIIGNIPYDITPLTLTGEKPKNIFIDSYLNIHVPKEINKKKLENEIEHIEQTLFKTAHKEISWKKLREIAGLEIIEQPINEGIYIKEEEGTIKNIFLQGDAEEIIFFVDEDERENILIKNNNDNFYIKYKEKNNINFISKNLDKYNKFEEKIYVNGNIKSINSQDKEFAFNKEANIYLYVRGFVAIKNSLKNIPSLKSNHFTLICNQKGIALKVQSQKKSSIAANIISQGNLEFNNQEGSELIGSIQCNNIKAKKQLKIKHQRNKKELLFSKCKDLAKIYHHQIYLGEITYGKTK